ncbi:hypothetical protein EBT25_00920 [bacterium]|jgi:hypothetical protein|nr:hypothetical protein [bacterium]
MHDDNYNIALLYKLAGGEPYNPNKWYTTMAAFVPTFPTQNKQPFVAGFDCKQYFVSEKDLLRVAGNKKHRR